MATRPTTPPDAGPEVFSAGATHSAGPNAYAAASGKHPKPAPRRKRLLRHFLLAFTALLVVLLVAALMAWQWLGRDDSLAYVLQRAVQSLPADQQLQTEGVRGSLRRGGHIDRLRWQSDTLSVEVQDLDIGWSLTPLLQKTLRFGKLEAARVVVTPQPKDEAKITPPTPLQQLSLPLQVDIPFAVRELVWAADKPVEAKALSGRYRYDGTVHHLEVAGVDVPQGHLSADVRVDGNAPMALDAKLQAQLQAQLPHAEAGSERTIGAQVEAQAKGTLTGQDARIALTAKLRTAPQDGAASHSTPPMQMDASASIAPWAVQPVLAAQADLQGLDLAELLTEAPATLLSGHIAAGPTQDGWDVRADLTNTHPAPWDESGLPVDAVTAHAHFDGSQWSTQDTRIQLGKGALAVQGSFAPESQSIALKVDVQHLDPAQLHTALAAAPLSGRATAEGSVQDFQFALQLTASGTPSNRKSAQAALRIDRVAARGTWKNGVLHLPQAEVAALQAQLKASNIQVATRPALAISGNVQAKLPGSSARADGTLAANHGAGTLRVEATSTQQTLEWLRSLPGLEKFAPGFAARGGAALNAQWRGGWEDITALPKAAAPAGKDSNGPQLQASLDAPKLQLDLPSDKGAAPTQIELRGVRLRADGSAARAELSLQGELRQGKQSAAVQSTVIARLAQATDKGVVAANAQMQSLGLTLQDGTHKGRWSLQAGAPFAIEVRRSAEGALAAKVGAGSAALTAPAPGQVALSWEPLAFDRSAAGALTLQTRGAITGIPLAWADLVGTQEPPVLKKFGLDTDLVFGGQWAVDAGEKLSANVRLQRSSGDLRIAMEDAPPATSVESKGDGAKVAAALRTRTDTIAAGLRDISLTLNAEGDTLRATFTWVSTQAGEVHAEASTRLQSQEGGWAWPESAAISGNVRAKLPQVGVWSVLAPPGWRVSGTLEADAALSGTRSNPQWNGKLSADKLTVRSLLDGVDLQDGHLRATLAGNRMDITEFSLKGGRGSSARIAGFSGNRTPPPLDGGSLDGSGSVQWASGSSTTPDLRMDFKARAKKLQVLVRADRQASVSGTLEATLRERQFKLRGDLHIDRASILLPDASAPSLGSDVVVRSKARDEVAQKNAQQAASATQRAETVLPPDVVVTLDLGDDFAFQGQGITTRLEGKLDIRSNTAANVPPRVVGEMRTIAGRYRAWGQMLDVETGLVRFSGPYNNPSLDILALRPNIEVRAGVQVTGSALNPRVRLYSEPDLPDAEKLSWVVLGRSAAAGGAEAAVLQQAALALLGGKGGGAGEKIASRLGLDEIGFKGPGAGEDASGAALTFGKRVSKNMYLTYERSLSGTLGTLYLFYDLSKRLRLRGQTGASTGLDLIYTVRYE
ncbi:MAG: translocation/assembly module TamB domain-containing protein [Giesbergeria sp.]